MCDMHMQSDLEDMAAVLNQLRATVNNLRRGGHSTFQLLQDHCVNARAFRVAFVRGELREARSAGSPLSGSSMLDLLEKWDSGGTLMLAISVAQGRPLDPEDAEVLGQDYDTIISGSQFHLDICRSLLRCQGAASTSSASMRSKADSGNSSL
jgi:hypothetical protein